MAAANKGWICVRLATYESEQEATLLKSFFVGRGGELENTTTVLVAPDGKTPLSAAGRGPSWLIDGVPRGPDVELPADAPFKLANVLQQQAKPFADSTAPTSLPVAADFRRALNIASCDRVPLVVLFSAGDEELAMIMQQRVAKLAWEERFIGQLQYVVVNDREELSEISDVPEKPSILIIEPGQFGIDGNTIEECNATATVRVIRSMFTRSLREIDIAVKDRNPHVFEGRRQGIKWESEIPVANPGPRRGAGGGAGAGVGRDDDDGFDPRRRGGRGRE